MDDWQVVETGMKRFLIHNCRSDKAWVKFSKLRGLLKLPCWNCETEAPDEKLRELWNKCSD